MALAFIIIIDLQCSTKQYREVTLSRRTLPSSP